ncbi:hypothetical protein SLE2022_315290 [Rubroshorea leprosula]
MGTGSVVILRRSGSTPGVYKRKKGWRRECAKQGEREATGFLCLGKFSAVLFVSANASHHDSSVCAFTDSIRSCLPQQMRHCESHKDTDGERLIFGRQGFNINGSLSSPALIT